MGNPEEVRHEYGLDCINDLNASDFGLRTSDSRFDAIILGVSHKEFLDLDLESLKKDNAIIYDVKGMLKGKADSKL